MEEVNIHKIDSDAYILKNKLMHRFDKLYGTRLMENDADDLSFLDIIYSVDSPDPLELYAEIKSIAHHGVTDQQKNFLYEIFPFFSNEPMEDDFDDIIAHIEKMIEKTGKTKNIAGASMIAFNDHEDSAIASYYRYPFSILRMQKLGNEKMQAMLVQNQCILILEIVLSLDLDS